MKGSFEGNTIGEEMDMNFFFLVEDVKELENNLDRQLSVSKSMAEKLKIKIDDIFEEKSGEKNSPIFKINPKDSDNDEYDFEVSSKEKLKVALEKKIK